MTIPVTSAWKLTFDDEFGGSVLNAAHWHDNWYGPSGGNSGPVNTSEELAAYAADHNIMRNGHLAQDVTTRVTTVNGHTYSYTGALVHSNGLFSQAYGYFEARLNLATNASGQILDWPAFWLDGQNWPEDGEIDIMEGLGGTASYHFHWGTDQNPQAVGHDYSGNLTGWHIFGVNWQPGRLDFYLDNNLVGSITSNVTSSPMYLILNNTIGVNSIQDPSTWMYVDWVHVYSSDPSAIAVTPEPGYTGPGGLGV